MLNPLNSLEVDVGEEEEQEEGREEQPALDHLPGQEGIRHDAAGRHHDNAPKDAAIR